MKPDFTSSPAWHEDAACGGDSFPDLWFPNGARDRRETELAIEICGGCDVRTKCLEWAVAENKRKDVTVHGIWGGRLFGLKKQYADDDLDPNDYRHGTVQGYWAGCRNACCRTAANEARKVGRANRGAS